MARSRDGNDRKAGRNAGKPNRPQTARGPQRPWRPEAAGGAPDRSATPAKGRGTGPRGRGKGDAADWLWGRHPVLAALSNPARRGRGRLVTTEERAAEIARDGLAPLGHRAEVMDAQALQALLPAGAVHQGLAFRDAPLDGVALEALAEPAEGVIVMLDQLTDPQNVGAVFRSALAFGARGVVVQDRHCPPLSGVLAKAAAGATERLACARVTNLSRALETLAEHGWRAVGLDGSAEETLEQALDGQPTVLVLGSEGEGLRRLVAEHCDALARIPMPGGFESLNVSNAAAVALYEATRARR